jgi:flagellar export protein FliJ
LRVRDLQEDQARAALLSANRAAHDAAAGVEDRLAEYATRSFPEGTSSHADFERALFLLDTAAGAVDHARASYRDSLAVVDDRRERWAAARRRGAPLEPLEARRRDEHALETRRAEDRLVDDIVMARHGGIR